MRMRILSMLMAGVIALTGCTSETEDMHNKESINKDALVLNVGLAGMQSRSGVTSSAFSNAEEIGVSIYSGTLTGDYNATAGLNPTTNVMYKAGGTTEAQTWTATQPIILSNVKGNLYAYYPYNKDATNPSAISMTVNSDQGTRMSDGKRDYGTTDYMYATPIADVSNAAPSQNLTMNHVLAMLSFKFVQTTGANKYPGKGIVNKIVLKNASGKETQSRMERPPSIWLQE